MYDKLDNRSWGPKFRALALEQGFKVKVVGDYAFRTSNGLKCRHMQLQKVLRDAGVMVIMVETPQGREYWTMEV